MDEDEAVMDEDEAEIEMVLEWAEEHPEFNTDFVESLSDQIAEGRELTEKQRDALNNIIERFDIE